MWQNPVHDRTISDVQYARTHHGSADLKGALNASDWNRIEGNIDYIYTQMLLYVDLDAITIKTWTATSLPAQADIVRLYNNINYLAAVWGAQTVYTANLDYQAVNSIEKLIADTRAALERSVGSLYECGGFGSDIGLALFATITI